jgi:glycosyltransferase involved in cell wall biosynthesis
MHPQLTIVGGGPEKETLQVLQVELQLDRQVQFAGVLSGEALVEMLNRHKIIVIPSRWREPFGLVALEGIACGCVAVGADGGGLPDAIGKCGLVFETGNVSSLAEQLAKLLRSDSDLELYRSAAPAHLAQHSSELVAARYLEVLQDAVQQHGGKCKGPNPRNVSVKDGE